MKTFNPSKKITLRQNSEIWLIFSQIAYVVVYNENLFCHSVVSR